MKLRFPQPTCYRVLNRHARGWGWVYWTHSELHTRLAWVIDLETDAVYPTQRRHLRTDWQSLPPEARALLKQLPPVVRKALASIAPSLFVRRLRS